MKNLKVNFSLSELEFRCKKLFDMGKALGSKSFDMGKALGSKSFDMGKAFGSKSLMVAFFILEYVAHLCRYGRCYVKVGK